MNKSLSYVNFSLELHVVSTFWLESDTSSTFSLYFAQQLYELERPALKMYIFWCRTDICMLQTFCKSILDVRQSISSSFLCKLNYTSVCFIHISTKITCKKLITFRRSHVVFEVIPRCFELLVNFNIT